MRNLAGINKDLPEIERAGVSFGVVVTGRLLKQEEVMLWTFCVVMIVLWLLGLVTSHTMGGLIHILLVIAIIMVLVRVIQGRKVL
jgi:hypothetical protein